MAGFKAISEWFPPKERALVNGLQNGGASVGAIVAPPLIVWLTIKFDWRTSFVITGAIGLVWPIGWLTLYSAPPLAAVATPNSYTAIFVIMGFLHPLSYLIVRYFIKNDVVTRRDAPLVQ